MVKTRVKKNIINKVKAFVNQAKNEGFNIQSAILFGSQVKGSAKYYSDIDVGVVSPEFGKDTISEGAKLHLLANKIDWRIEPHPLNPKDLKRLENPFVYEILRTGIKIV